MPPLDQLFSADHLFNPEPGAPSAIYGVIGILYLLVLAVSVAGYVARQQLFAGHRLKVKLAERVTTVGMIVGALGFILVVLRYFGVPVLSARIILYIVVLVSLLLVAYFVYYLLARYPARRAAYEAEELRRRYLPRPKPRPAAIPSRQVHGRKKGKKRR